MARFLSCLALSLAVVSSTEVRSWLTTADVNSGAATNLLTEQSPIWKSTNPRLQGSNRVDVDIYADDIKQQILGYGAGLPQSSAYVLNNLKTRNVQLYNSVLEKLFGNSGDGAAINILRFPIGSCDFSMTATTYDEVQGDYSLNNFAIDADSKLIVSVLKDILKVNPSLILIATPWSAPSWLKTWDTLIAYSNQNTLIDSEQAYDTYAQYFALVLKAYQDEGLTVQYFTLQNEPLFGNSNQYPGMYFSSAQAARLGTKVHALLGSQVKLLSYDHNWDVPSYPLEVLASTPAGTFAGTAWHCYAGDMASSMDQMHTAYPNVDQHVTECTGGYPDSICDISKGMEGFGWNHEWDMTNILLGAAGHWSSSGVKWILALDESCGPTLPDVAFTSGRPLVAIPSWASAEADIKYNQDYYSIKHMSKFLTPLGQTASAPTNTTTTVNKAKTAAANGQTVRVGSAFEGVAASSLILESFYSAASNTVTMIAMNKDHTTEVALQVEQGGEWFADTLPVFSTKVYQWQKA